MKSTTLNDVVDFQTGFAFKSKDYVSTGIRLLRGDNIAQGTLRWDGAKFWPETEASEILKYSLCKGDVILAMDRPWIEAGLKYASVREDDLPALLVQRVARLRGTDKIDGGFLKYLIGSTAFTDHILNITTGTAVPHISGKDILSFKFELPNREVQQQIAAILGALDDKIEVNRKASATLEEMARALYRSWFVDFDPVHAKAEGRSPAHMDAPTAALFPDSFGEDGLPMGWQAGKVEDLFVLQRGFDLPATQRQAGPYPVLSASGYHGFHNEYRVKGPGVTTGRSGIIGQVFLILEDFWPLNTSLWVKEFKRGSAYYAYFAMQNLDLRSLNSGSAVPSLNRNYVHDLEAVVPSKGVVDAFDAIAIPIFEKASALKAESQTLAALRDSLLPRLMSGELRVGVAQDIIEEAL